MVGLLATLLIGAPQSAEMAGYLIVPHTRVPRTYNAGFSMYVAAWPLLRNYPGQDFQSGLFGTWMFAQFEGEEPKDHYSNIEGGLGWWRDTRFATETPKFIMGGVTLNFAEWANGPGAGKGRDWNNPTGLYAVAQLSPWVLWPPDGLNLKQGTRGELFGYGYLPLPLIDPRSTTFGVPVPTGGQSWTLFLNTANFKGPLTFFVPSFWSRASAEQPKLAGLFLDTLPSEPNRAIQMETQHVPAVVAEDRQGRRYARVAPTLFPPTGAPLIHRVTAYTKAALWDGVQAWFAGGPAANSRVDPRASAMSTFKDEGYATWTVYPPGVRREDSRPITWNAFANPVAPDRLTYSYRWSASLKPDRGLATLPEYYRLAGTQWVVVPASEVPPETGLAERRFPRDPRAGREPYVTPDDPGSVWKRPGPKAGPFRVRLGDGSTVTYFWYRFADQPAMMKSGLTNAERERVQTRVEKLHRSWTKDREYLAPPTVGQLASLDPALFVRPPRGLEVGYVPIVTRQELR